MKQHCHGNSLHDQYLYERGDNNNAKKNKIKKKNKNKIKFYP